MNWSLLAVIVCTKGPKAEIGQTVQRCLAAVCGAETREILSSRRALQFCRVLCCYGGEHFYSVCVLPRGRRREQRAVDGGSICCGRQEAGELPAGRQLPVRLRRRFEKNLPLSPEKCSASKRKKGTRVRSRCFMSLVSSVLQQRTTCWTWPEIENVWELETSSFWTLLGS